MPQVGWLLPRGEKARQSLFHGILRAPRIINRNTARAHAWREENRSGLKEERLSSPESSCVLLEVEFCVNHRVIKLLIEEFFILF